MTVTLFEFLVSISTDFNDFLSPVSSRLVLVEKIYQTRRLC